MVESCCVNCFVVGREPGLDVVEFIWKMMCRPIQIELVWPRLFLVLVVRKPFFFPVVVMCLEKLWDIVLGMGGNVGKVAVVDGEDVLS